MHWVISGAVTAAVNAPRCLTFETKSERHALLAHARGDEFSVSAISNTWHRVGSVAGATWTNGDLAT